MWENMITPVQPGEVGLFVNRTFTSKFTAVDAKQAFLDTLLADALVVSVLPHDVGAGVGTLRHRACSRRSYAARWPSTARSTC